MYVTSLSRHSSARRRFILVIIVMEHIIMLIICRLNDNSISMVDPAHFPHVSLRSVDLRNNALTSQHHAQLATLAITFIL